MDIVVNITFSVTENIYGHGQWKVENLGVLDMNKFHEVDYANESDG